MNKTQPLPTDAELAAFTASAEWAAYETPMLVDFARAVLAKWGTPAPVGVEPVAIYHGRCTIDCGEHGHLDMELLKMIPAGTKLYTAEVLAMGRVPLDRDEIRTYARESLGDVAEEAGFYDGVRWAEEKHGIKQGGQHADT